MDDLIQAIASNDLVKFKRCFAEGMKAHVGNILAEEKLAIAKSIMVEGEYVVEAEDEAVEDEDESEDDEADEKPAKKGKKDEE